MTAVKVEEATCMGGGFSFKFPLARNVNKRSNFN